MRIRAIRGTGFVALILASCIHGGGPPSVTPAAKLTPRPDEDAPRSTADFAVVFAGPRGQISQGNEAIPTVVFNRAMRTLDGPDAPAPGLATLKTKDGRVVAGMFRFVGTRGLVFEPDKAALPAATEFEVTIAAGARALDGSTLVNPYSFGFSTARPHVVDAPFSGRKDLKPDSALRLELDQDIDPAEIAKQAKLLVRTKPDAPPKTIAVTARRPAKGVPPPRANHVVDIVPSEKLPLDATIELVLPKGFKASEGPLGTFEERKIAARTYGPLRLEDVHCYKESLGRCKANQQISVVLSNSVARKELLSHLDVAGGEPAKLLVAKNVAPTSTSHVIVAQPKEGKHYKVTIRKGLHDVFGQVLEKDIVFAVDTEAPFVGGPKPGKGDAVAPPDTTDDEPPLKGVPAPEPGVAHRPRLDFQAQIGVTGTVLEANTHDGIKSHKVPIGVVNVPTVGVWSGSMKDTDVLRWIGGGHADGPTGAGWAWSWFTPGVAENVRAVKTVDLDALLGGGATPHGAALMALSVPGQGMPYQSALVSVTDLAIAARVSKFGSLVWVTRLSNGAPVANASVRIVRVHPKKPEQAEAFSGTTDANGLVEIPEGKFDPVGKMGLGNGESQALFVVKSGDDWTFQPVERSYTSNVSYSTVDLFARNAYEGLIFTERGVYRPGETIKLAGIIRRANPKGLEAPAGKEVKLQVSDGEGNDLLQTRAKVDAFGSFAVDVPISKTAKYGTGLITVSMTGGVEQGLTSTSFLLAAYKASAFKASVEPKKPAYVRGDEFEFDVVGEYLYGAPMAGATIHGEYTRASIAWTPPKSDGFLFGDDEPHGYVAASLGNFDDDLDDKGHFEPKLKTQMNGQYGPERVTLEAELQDATHQTVAKSTSVLVHPAEFYLGLERQGSRFLSLPGATPSLEIRPKVAAIEPNGNKRAGVAVTIELFERKWTSNVVEQPDGSAATTSKQKDELIGSCTVTTTAAASASCPLVVKEAGYYLIKAHAKDARGNESSVGTAVYVLAEKPAANTGTQAWSKSDLRVVQLEADKSVYKPGEKAKILVHNPFGQSKGVQALVTVERGGVLQKQVIPLDGPMPIVELPVKSEWFPNVYVSIDVVRGRIKAPPASGKLDLGGPEFRMGTTELNIDPESHRLKLAITPTKTKLSPGETFDADVAVTDDTGKPTVASITFYAVDDGVLMLTGYKTPDPLPPFAERRLLSVAGLDSREHLARILPMKAGEKVPILGWDYPPQAEGGWAKGYQYGDGGGSSNTPRMDFRATAFFEAGRVTSADGHAKFHVKLPDNLTSYRLMAVASSVSGTGDDRFGFGEAGVTASKKLMIRPALPRAIRIGDAFEASMVIATKDLGPVDVDVSVRGDHLALEGPVGLQKYRVHVEPGQQVPVRFHVRPTTPGTATLDVTATAAGVSDRVVLTRTVSLPTSIKSVAAYGETTGASGVELGALEGLRPDEGGLEVKLASSALVGLESSFDRLIEYPYGCTEQLVSRTLPLLSMRDLAQQSGVRMPAKLDPVIDDAIAKVLAHQSGDGGFGFWDDDQPVVWLSAYATFVLEEARKKGYAVPKEATDRAFAYLAARLPSTIPPADDAQDDGKKDDDGAAEDDAHGPLTDDLSPEDKRGLMFAQASMIVDAMASSGVPSAGTLNRLYDARKNKPLFAQAFLLHAMAAAKMPQQQLESFAKEIEARLKVDANSATAAPEGPVYAPMLDSSARTTALVLRALLSVDAKNPLAPRLARGLLSARTDGAWKSTQENVWALVALDAYRKAQESVSANFDGKAWFGGDEIGHALFAGVHEETFFVPASALTKAKGSAVTVQMQGQGKLFWSAELQYATTALPTKPLDHGFFIEKRVRGVTPAELEAALKQMPKGPSSQKAKVGELVLVDLLFETAEARDQVVIDDPLPSGVEPLEVKLETVAKSQDIGDGPSMGYASTKKLPSFAEASVHREHRDDRVLTFLGHVDPGLFHFRYLARATSSGTFVVPPTTALAMYAPEVNGRTAATTFTVTRE